VPKPKLSARPLPERIAKARREGRTQQALELARQLFKDEPADAQRDLVRQVTLERGTELQLAGHYRDAAILYASALSLAGSPDFDAALALRLAACGNLTDGLRLVANREDEKSLQARLTGQAADYAVQHGGDGLPVELRGQLHLILKAFAASQAGHDDEARTALQEIGLQSPFLEWKVLLRGLLAYYAGDDVRALENWQRLDPARLPYRLAAPLRFRLDPAYRHAQPPATQNYLADKSARLFASGIEEGLHGLKEKLTRKNLAPAFRQAEQLVPVLQRDQPLLVPRLAHCFYWAIIAQGEPEDVDRYERVFGTPSDDPDLGRLEALALETRGMLSDAHKAWQEYLRTMTPQAWPGEQHRHAQALVWAHMGMNALPEAQRRQRATGSPLDFLFPTAPAHLKPPAEVCFRKSIKLVPDRLEYALALLNLHLREKQIDKAKKVGADLLKRFPDHADTLVALGDIALDEANPGEAVEYFQRALAANPLQPQARRKVAQAHQQCALDLGLQDQFDAARQQLQSALSLTDGRKTLLLCQAAALEMRAGDATRATAWFDQARAEPDQRLASAYTLWCEAVRIKLPTARRNELAAAFEHALTQAPTPAETLALLETAAGQRAAHRRGFTGQKTRERALVKFLERLSLEAFNEKQLERLATSLLALQVRKPLKECLREAEYRFPNNPVFCLYWVDYCATARQPEYEAFQMKLHLDKARTLAEAMPRGEEQQQLLERIKQREAKVQEMSRAGLNDMMAEFGDIFEMLGEEDDD
jgi:tetratricopeptide (TPR) repeat protein